MPTNNFHVANIFLVIPICYEVMFSQIKNVLHSMLSLSYCVVTHCGRNRKMEYILTLSKMILCEAMNGDIDAGWIEQWTKNWKSSRQYRTSFGHVQPDCDTIIERTHLKLLKWIVCILLKANWRLLVRDAWKIDMWIAMNWDINSHLIIMNVWNWATPCSQKTGDRRERNWMHIQHTTSLNEFGDRNWSITFLVRLLSLSAIKILQPKWGFEVELIKYALRGHLLKTHTLNISHSQMWWRKVCSLFCCVHHVARVHIRLWAGNLTFFILFSYFEMWERDEVKSTQNIVVNSFHVVHSTENK